MATKMKTNLCWKAPTAEEKQSQPQWPFTSRHPRDVQKPPREPGLLCVPNVCTEELAETAEAQALTAL